MSPHTCSGGPAASQVGNFRFENGCNTLAIRFNSVSGAAWTHPVQRFGGGLIWWLTARLVKIWGACDCYTTLIPVLIQNMLPSPRVAICAIVRDEARYIREWIAFHLLQGISQILIYDEGSCDDTKKIISDAAKRANVGWVDWSGKGGAFDTIQRQAYEDGAFRLTGNADFVAFIDADEFLYCHDGRPLPAELATFSAQTSAVAVNQRLFGSSGLKTYKPDYVTSRFTRCTRPDNLSNRWYKTVARPERISEIETVHSVNLRAGDYVLNDHQPFEKNPKHPGSADRIGAGKLLLNHYMLKSFEEYGWKQARGRSRGLGGRYDDAFFTSRDSDDWANAVVNERLKAYAPSIADMIVKLWLSDLFT